jgi:predicted phage terminase large subunit-like protein
VVRGQWSSEQRDAIIRQTTELDARRGSVAHSLPQDPGAAGKTQAEAFIRLLAGFAVETSLESGDKETRADPYSSQWNAGNVALLRADWNAAYLAELETFPQGKRKDQVDASSRAFGKLAGAPSLQIFL